MEHNPDILTAKASRDKSGFQLQGSKASFLPQLSANSSINKVQTSAANRTQSQDFDQTSDNFSIGMSLKQNIYAGMRDNHTTTKKKIDLETFEIGINKTIVQIIYDLKIAYTQHIYSKKLIDLYSRVVSRRKENLRLVDLRFQGGRENKGAHLKSQASTMQAEFDSAQAGRSLSATKAQLAKVLGRTSSTDIEIEGQLDEPSLPAQKPDFNALSKNIPAYLEATKIAASSKVAIDIIRSQSFPTIDVAASLNRVGSTWPPDANKAAIGLSLTWPLYTGGLHTADLNSAAAENARANAALVGVTEQISVDLQDNYNSLIDAVEKLKVLREFLKAAEVQAEIAKSQYSLGLLTFQEWDIIENELINDQKTLLLGQKDAVLAEAAWGKAKGESQ